MIKNILLKGISKTPTDRMAADGGCVESLNVQMENGEIAPVPEPEPVTLDKLGVGYLTDQDCVYIHKFGATENFIVWDKSTIAAKRGIGYYDKADGEYIRIVPFAEGETLKSITHIGKTLIVYSSVSSYYSLWNGLGYKYLGESIPMPAIEPLTHNYGQSVITDLEIEGDLGSPTGYCDKELWREARSINSGNHNDLLQTMKNAWEKTNLLIAELRNDGEFVAPFFLVYALRLYDNTYANISVPMFCGARDLLKNHDWIRLAPTYNSGVYNPAHLYITLWSRFDVRLKLRNANIFENWKDIVKSVDVFISEPIMAPALNSPFEEMVDNPDPVATEGEIMLLLKGMTAADRDETIKSTVLSRSNFYLAKSFDLADLGEIEDGWTLKNNEEIFGENLVQCKRLPDDYRSGNGYSPIIGAVAYNNRLLLKGYTERLTSGAPTLNGEYLLGVQDPEYDNKGYIFRYTITDPLTGADYRVLSRYMWDKTKVNCPPGWAETSTIEQHFGDDAPLSTVFVPAFPSTWLAYPDSRCHKVEIFRPGETAGTLEVTELEMTEHPFIECAYSFLGFGKRLDELTFSPTSETYSEVLASEIRDIEQPNKAAMSSVDNPFSFPVSGFKTFGTPIIDLALITKALSQGQFGQYDIYAFTEEGISTIAINPDGSFGQTKHLSSDVAVPGTVVSIEQAIVFTTNKGVMLLSGSSPSCISTEMVGKNYALEEDAKDAIEDSEDWARVALADNSTPFLSFMKAATAVWDYAGRRIIFFNKDIPSYQYVLKIDSNTWHGMSLAKNNADDIAFVSALNSYPECFVCVKGRDGKRYIYNFSTVLDTTDGADTLRGMIATRALNLDASDAYKTIEEIKVRGDYLKGQGYGIKWLLLGSNDGVSFHLLHSLRGPSWKFHRIILLVNIKPTDRISYIETEFKARFTNKIR